MSSAVLSPARAGADRERLAAERFDVLVVGGGIVGAGAALDAATRGLSVAIVEAQDWAAGTSSRSSKLIHGGLRYLQMRDFALVREALRERAVLVRLAPHLVHPLPILFPLRDQRERAYVSAGVSLYDLLARADRAARASASSFPRHHQLGRRATQALAPGLSLEHLVGGIRFFDAQVDDARYALSVLRTAVAHGAVAVSRAAVTGLVAEEGRVVGASVRHLEDGTVTTARAGVVVGAAGVWSTRLAALAGADDVVALQPSKGVHLVVPRGALELDSALILPTDTSVLFVLPWGKAHWIVGTTDTPWSGTLARPAASATDVAYVLATLNKVLTRPLVPADVEAVYVGLRPLLATGAAATTRLSREHAVVRAAPGCVLVSGGKYTTYRVMAADVIDAALRELGGPSRPSVTAEVSLVGSGAGSRSPGGQLGLSVEEQVRLVGRYGDEAAAVAALAASDPALGAPIGGYLGAEFVYGVTHEGARHLDDVLERRTRLAIERPDRGAGVAGGVAALIAPHLGWGRAAVEREVAAYRSSVAASVLGTQRRDDAGAAAALATAKPLLPLP